MNAPLEALHYADAEEHLAAHLRRVALCVERTLRSARLGRPSAALDGASIAGRDAQRLSLIEQEMDALDVELAERSVGAGLPIVQLAHRFSLSPAAVHLLMAAAAPGFAVHLARGYEQALNRDDGQPDVGFLIELLARDPAEERLLLGELQPQAPLVRWRLLRLGAARGWVPEGPQLRRPVAVPERIADWISGRTAFSPERFEHVAELRDGAGVQLVESPVVAMIERALGRERAGRPLPLVVVGASLAGKATALVTAAARRGYPALTVNLEALAPLPHAADLLRDLLREARLLDALLVLRRGDSLDEPRQRQLLLPALAEPELRVALTLRAAPAELLRLVPDLQAIPLGLPSAGEQRQMWRRALPDTITLDPPDLLDQVVHRYHLHPGDIQEAAAGALASVRLRGGADTVALDDVVKAVRARLSHRLGDVAELMATSLEWTDLVVRAEVKERLDELVASVKFQTTVMSDWGFHRKLAYGRAISALFSGPPGTGKTMVATLLAKALGLELFRVDLSRVVSKWVGETEKNLGRAFDEAQTAQAILLFDEADALFAKRTDVKSSNDRYANLEVNYLLQRLEGFEGVVLLTTNNQTAIDDAFRRRLRFRVDFPTPDEEEREKLWQAMLPASAPVEPELDFTTLARKYEMTGGYIKNAVVRAAYLAAATEERIITADILLLAAQREWEDMGKLTMR